jgi:autotransporter-associated beta strand repeat
MPYRQASQHRALCITAPRLPRTLRLAALGGAVAPGLLAQGIEVSGSVQTVDTGLGQYVNATPDSQSHWNLEAVLSVGRNAPGALHISGGAVVSSPTGVVGTELITSPNGDGTVTIDGTGSAWNMTGQLNVGLFSPGSITISDGGALTALTAVIGSNDGGVGTVTVAGPGSSFVLAGGPPSQLIIGNSGVGSFSVLAGGFVSSADISVGQSVTGIGSGLLTVSGAGSLLEATRLLAIGDGSSSSLMEIRDGGAVVSQAAYIGSAGGHGDVLVTGAGSTWETADEFYIGMYNSGSLRIEDQAAVTSNDSVIGIFGAGDAVVTGPDTQWNSTGFIGIGYATAGSLTVEKGAHVVTPAVELGTTSGGAGELILLGDADGVGTLTTGAVEKGAGSAMVRFDGGRLRASDSFTITGFADGAIQADTGGARIDTNGHDIVITFGIAGAGGLIKEGEGTLLLEGDNTYLGVTVIEAGRLLQSGGMSSSGVIVKAGAIFGGSGALAGDLTIEEGGKFDFTSRLTFTVLGDVFLDSSFGVDDIAGLDAGIELGIYTLIDGTATDFTLLGIENWGADNAFDLGGGKIAYFQSGGLQLVITSAIPEPGACALLAGLAAAFVATRRRR